MLDWRKLTPQLRKPFHPSAITWKPGATNGNKDAALGMAYADLRAYQDRLDELLPGEWSVSYTPWGDRIICNLTIGTVTRSSTGEPDSQSERSEIAGTATEAQSFKRACSAFGLGRYLYHLPSTWADYDGQRRTFTDKGKAKLDKIVWDHYRAAHVATIENVDDGYPGSPAPDDPDIVGRPTAHEEALQHARQQRVTGVDKAQAANKPNGAQATATDAQRAVQVVSQLTSGKGAVAAVKEQAARNVQAAAQAGDEAALWAVETLGAEVEFMGPTKGATDVGAFVWPVEVEELETVAASGFPGEEHPVTRMANYLRQKDQASKYPMTTVKKDGTGSGQYGYLVSLLDARYGKNSHRAILSLIFGRPVSKEQPPGGLAKEIIDWLKDEADSVKYIDQLVELFKESWG